MSAARGSRPHRRPTPPVWVLLLALLPAWVSGCAGPSQAAPRPAVSRPAAGPSSTAAPALPRAVGSAAAVTAGGHPPAAPSRPSHADRSTAGSTAPSTAGSTAPAAAESTSAPSTAGSTAPSTAGSTSAPSTGGLTGRGRPASSPPAALPSAVRAVEGLTFPRGVETVSAGPGQGDLAVSAVDTVYVVLGGRLAATIPEAQAARWVPGGDWVLYARTDAPTIQGVRVIGYRAVEAGGGAGWNLPACAARPQPLPGPAVAFLCRGALEIASLTASGLGAPRTYPWTAHLGSGAAAAGLVVDPTRRLAAAVSAKGWITAHRLSDGRPLPGTFMAAAPNGPMGLAWSPGGVLAVAWPAGFSLWTPGGRVVMVPSAAYDNVIRWLPGGAALVAASSFAPASPRAGHRVGLDGSSRTVIPPDAGPVLAFSAGGRYFWRAAAPVARPGAPSSPPGPPDRLVAQPVP